ncbi:hypothetical protein Pan216_09230 [Planctomycetes bacterium Pan216]|uniref:Thiamine-binding protein domain-containing protein n=1 Tax=Kolteria novifilia TaxID=2527975 RepID=A0A518AZE9_9BACT|nr:hypothetical protein Pan216_09230 [Planctomycetes bacterium Pan216]
MSLLLEFSISPLGKGESVSDDVAECLAIVRDSGLDYRLHAMGTVLEGEWDDVMAVVKKCRDCLRARHSRIFCIIKFDDRDGPGGRLERKVTSVLDKVDGSLNVVERVDD